MKLSKDQVKHIAKLASLPLTDAQIDEYGEQLSKILDYAELLSTVDTENIEPTYNVSGDPSTHSAVLRTSPLRVLREDQEEAGLSAEEALKNAASKQDGFVVTKGVFEE